MAIAIWLGAQALHVEAPLMGGLIVVNAAFGESLIFDGVRTTDGHDVGDFPFLCVASALLWVHFSGGVAAGWAAKDPARVFSAAAQLPPTRR